MTTYHLILESCSNSQKWTWEFSAVSVISTASTTIFEIFVLIFFPIGNIHNNIKINYQRPEVAGVHKAYTICAQYESKYNDFGKEMLALNDGEKLKVEGKASLQYGESTECDQGDGELRYGIYHWFILRK